MAENDASALRPGFVNMRARGGGEVTSLHMVLVPPKVPPLRVEAAVVAAPDEEERGGG